MNISVNPEVQAALEKGLPVVALESTIISHGMPYPQNVETAARAEEIVRENGGVPATIGIIDGVGIVGMTPEEIEKFGKRGKEIKKVSKRDLPIVLAKGEWGATTVASTMIFASRANIEFFVTGGIGGVHRGAETTFDISADLEELAQRDMTVICAGPKAMLDIPKTLEYLETKGVSVLSYQTDELPAFYSRHSGLKTDYGVKDAKEAALIVKTRRDLGLNGSILIANPISEEDSLDPVLMNEAIDKAIIEMEEKNIQGKECTPFLLEKIVELTNGTSLESNIKLVFNNAKVGTMIAKEYSQL